MREYMLILVAMLFAFSCSAFCQDIAEAVTVPDFTKIPKGPVGHMVTKEDANDYLTKYIPDEYLLYQTALKNNNEADTVTAVIAMITQARTIYVEHIKTVHDFGHAKQYFTYEFAWLTAMQCRKSLKTEKEKDRILAEWDSSLKLNLEDTEILCSQIRSLLWEWDQSFLTENCVKVFNDSFSPEVITSYCRVFEIHGGNIEKELVNKKLKQLKQMVEVYNKMIGTLSRVVIQTK